MLSRKNEMNEGTALPIEWLEQVKKILIDTYSRECVAADKAFHVYGETHPNEFLLIISLFDQDAADQSWTSIFLSSDLDEQTKYQKTLDGLIDASGMILDNYFSNINIDQEWDEPNDMWTQASFKSSSFYYKVNRENIGLTLKANALLNN